MGSYWVSVGFEGQWVQGRVGVGRGWTGLMEEVVEVEASSSGTCAEENNVRELNLGVNGPYGFFFFSML